MPDLLPRSVEMQDLVGDRGTVILSGIVGSTAYGLSGPGSDIDQLGIYGMPTVNLHSLRPPNLDRATITSTGPDATLHEAWKFATLALKCNPTVTELLWLPAHLHTTVHPLGVQLVTLRESFLHFKGVKDAYLGYAEQQLDRLIRTSRFPDVPISRIEKHARHLLRLLDQGVHLWRTGELQVRVDDPDRYFDFARSVAADPSYALTEFRIAEAHFQHAGVLAAKPDTEIVDAWLRNLRTYFLQFSA